MILSLLGPAALLAAFLPPLRAQPVDILGLVELENVLASFPHDLETFEYGGPVAHFPAGPSITMSEDGEIERIDVPPDGWSCRMLHFFFVRAEAQVCPDDFTTEEQEALTQAEEHLIEAYSSFVVDAGVSLGWTSVERRIELRAIGLASSTRLDLLCTGEPRETRRDVSDAFLTTEGVATLLADTSRPVIALLPFPDNQCAGFD